MTDDIQKILDERQRTHGDFATVASVATSIKTIMRGVVVKSAVARESLDLIATKIARIICGNPDLAEHWDDIAGYAKLVSNDIAKRPSPVSDVYVPLRTYDDNLDINTPGAGRVGPPSPTNRVTLGGWTEEELAADRTDRAERPRENGLYASTEEWLATRDNRIGKPQKEN